MTAARLRRLRGDAGLSLVELLVTAVIAGVVLPLVVGVLIRAQDQTASTVDRAAAGTDLRLALQSLDVAVRDAATPLPSVSSDGRAFGFWSAASGGRCIQFKLVAAPAPRTDLLLVTRGFASATTAPPPWAGAAVVASGLAPTPAPPPSAGTAPAFALASGGRSVEVVLSARGRRGPLVTLKGSLAARNATTPASTSNCGNYTG